MPWLARWSLSLLSSLRAILPLLLQLLQELVHLLSLLFHFQSHLGYLLLLLQRHYQACQVFETPLHPAMKFLEIPTLKSVPSRAMSNAAKKSPVCSEGADKYATVSMILFQ